MPHFGEAQSQLAPILGLDDYREGDWTPVFKNNNAGAAVVFTITEAKYTKIGRLVVATFYVTRNDATALAGAITWSLPFPTTGTTGLIPCGQFWAQGKGQGGVLIDNFAADIANGLMTAAGGVNTYLKYSDLANGEILGVTMVYQST